MRKDLVLVLASAAFFIAVLISLEVTQPNYSAIYCEGGNIARENCAAYNVFLVFWWKVGKFFDDHNGTFTALFTLVLAFFTISMARSTKRLVLGADETSKHQLRAYIAVDIDHPIRDRTYGVHIEDDNIMARFFLKNHGQTPAYGVVTAMNIRTGKYPLDKELPHVVVKKVQGRGKGILNPGQISSFDCSTGWGLTADDKDKISSGHKALYVYGRVEFYDVFGNHQWIKFQYVCGATSGHSAGLMIDDEGNDAS